MKNSTISTVAAAALFLGLISPLALGSPPPAPAQCQNVCDQTDPTTGQPTCHQVCNQAAAPEQKCTGSRLAVMACKQGHAKSAPPQPKTHAAPIKAPPASTAPAGHTI